MVIVGIVWTITVVSGPSLTECIIHHTLKNPLNFVALRGAVIVTLCTCTYKKPVNKRHNLPVVVPTKCMKLWL